MATKGKPAASNRKKPAAPAASRAAAAAPAAAAKPAARKKPPSRVGPVMATHRTDVAAIGWSVAAILVFLGTFTSVIGPVGSGIAWFGGLLVGKARYVLPVLFGLFAAAVISDRKADHPVRMAVGASLVVLPILGVFHVKWGPVYGTPIDELRNAGGLLGAAVGRPLQMAVADAGAIILLIAVFMVGMLVATKANVRTVMSSTARGITPTLRAARGAARNVSTLASERLGATPDERQSRPAFYDLDDESDVAAPSKEMPAPKRPRREVAGPPPLPVPMVPKGVQGQLGLDNARNWGYRLPDHDVLAHLPEQQIDMGKIIARGQKLQAALASHGVETKVIGQTCGPTVTRYELSLGEGVKVASVMSLSRDIAYALASADLRILAPIPGKSAIGVEVPNEDRALVTLGDVLHSAEGGAAQHPLEVAVGKGIDGRGVMMNLASTPHLLIAGATGAGKSSGINCIVTSILMRTRPDEVKLILIDPKQVEMGQYARLPHLLTQPVTNPKKAANALSWAVQEMERRYDLLSAVGFRDITGYNKAFDAGQLVAEPEPGREDEEAPIYERLPFIVIIVDELNDLMMVAARDVEDSVTRIAQKARAVGIHLIVATQRPSVNVITGVIKANIPARMAFAVSSLTDSRVILDQPGAERLVGKGDMLLLGPSSNVAQRIQGAFVSEEEVRKVVAHCKAQPLEPNAKPVAGIESDAGERGGSPGFTSSGGGSNGDDDDDETLMRNAMELVVRSQLGSTSMLQRKLKVGFARAGRIMDLLEQQGVVGPSEGSKARTVLMTVEEFEELR